MHQLSYITGNTAAVTLQVWLFGYAAHIGRVISQGLPHISQTQIAAVLAPVAHPSVHPDHSENPSPIIMCVGMGARICTMHVDERI
jgi:hypothetical protein